MDAGYIRRRILGSLVAILGVSVLVFLLVHLIPGDPIDNLLGEAADPVDKAQMRACMDLDQSLPVYQTRPMLDCAVSKRESRLAVAVLHRAASERTRPLRSPCGHSNTTSCAFLLSLQPRNVVCRN